MQKRNLSILDLWCYVGIGASEQRGAMTIHLPSWCIIQHCLKPIIFVRTNGVHAVSRELMNKQWNGPRDF